MKRTIAAFAFALASIAATPGWAATRTATLFVPGMTCAACPITVKKALARVDGVQRIEVAFAKREVMVTFDDRKASLHTLTKATGDAGYPSTIQP